MKKNSYKKIVIFILLGLLMQNQAMVILVAEKVIPRILPLLASIGMVVAYKYQGDEAPSIVKIQNDMEAVWRQPVPEIMQQPQMVPQQLTSVPTIQADISNLIHTQTAPTSIPTSINVHSLSLDLVPPSPIEMNPTRFNWQERLQITEAPAAHITISPQVITEQLTNPFVINPSRQLPISAHYFESFRQRGIEQHLHFTTSVNGQQRSSFGNSDSRLHANINIITHNNLPSVAEIQYAMNERALYEICRDGLIGQLRQEYTSFTENIARCSDHSNRTAIFDALRTISTPSNFTVLNRVPYLSEKSTTLTKELQNIWLNNDGSLRTGITVGYEKNIARATAQFFMPLNGNNNHFLHIVSNLKQQGFPGAQDLFNELHNKSNRSYFDQLGEGVFNIFDSIEMLFYPSKKLPDLSKAFLNHPVNQDLKMMIDQYKIGNWDAAKAITDKYSNNGIFRTISYELGYKNGIFQKYASPYNPEYARFMQRAYPCKPNYEANAYLEQHHQIKEHIVKTCQITKPSPLVERLAYELVPIIHDPAALSQSLSILSQDSANPLVRNAYHAFHDSNGIPKLVSYDKSILEKIFISPAIGDARNAYARELLTILVKVDIPHQQAKTAIQQGLACVARSCSGDELSSHYLAQGDAICKAVAYGGTDKTILHVGNLLDLHETEEQRAMQEALLPLTAHIAQTLNKPLNQQNKIELRSTLIGIDTVCAATKENKHALAKKFYLKSIAPHIECVAQEIKTLKPYTIHMHNFCNATGSITFNQQPISSCSAHLPTAQELNNPPLVDEPKSKPKHEPIACGGSLVGLDEEPERHCGSSDKQPKEEFGCGSEDIERKQEDLPQCNWSKASHIVGEPYNAESAQTGSPEPEENNNEGGITQDQPAAIAQPEILVEQDAPAEIDSTVQIIQDVEEEISLWKEPITHAIAEDEGAASGIICRSPLVQEVRKLLQVLDEIRKQKQQSDTTSNPAKIILSEDNEVIRSIDMLNGHAIKKFDIIKKMYHHIFSDDHEDEDIYSLGTGATKEELQNSIIQSFVTKIIEADKKKLLMDKSNQIETQINGVQATIRIRIENESVIFMNGFKGISQRKLGNLIKL